MKPARWHQHKITKVRIFGHELEVGDCTKRGDVYESTYWRITSLEGETLTPAAVVRTRYIRPVVTPADSLGIAQAELDALVIAAVNVKPPIGVLLASLLDKLSPGDDALKREWVDVR
jgi:hypothetical protein